MSSAILLPKAIASRPFRPFSRRPCKLHTTTCCSSKHEGSSLGQLVGAAVLAASLQLGGQWPALATPHLTLDGLNALTYKEVKGSGIAATCPIISPGPGSSDMPAGTYQIEQFCLEPTAFYVREEGEDDFDPTKVLTRQTYTLDMMTGKLDVSKNGPSKLRLNEDGLDYAPVSLQPIPAGEYVPLMFTARNMVLEGANGELRGTYTVPSYRGSAFMDPRGRGASTGYDYALGLAAAGDADEYQRTNNKNVASPGQGEARLKVDVTDTATKEMGGTFQMMQVSDNDMGAKESKDIAVVGVWYARMA